MADDTFPSDSELRRREPGHRTAESVASVDSSAIDDRNDGRPRKTYGKTPSGQVFVVPPTHDMVSTLLSPTEPKNLSDLVVLAILGVHFLLYFFLPASIRTPVLLSTFIFWRASYNAGIGYLLHVQSNYRRLVHWAKVSGIFDPEAQPRLYKIIKSELSCKIPEDYDFDKAPIEYNTWLLFRRLVDLILMADFVSYSLFAFSCASVPEGENPLVALSRWAGGIALILFNLWVKLDAHRVVKDYAWYWGDFFFLVEQNLTFDGVFEMAPHPMYSVGYAGYYGLSLIVASYTVLFASLAAHAAQFIFLALVENPHIDKTYNPPPPRRKSAPPPSNLSRDAVGRRLSNAIADKEEVSYKSLPTVGKLDLHHIVHVVTILLTMYLVALSLLTPSTPTIQTLFVLHALAWRIWNTFGIGLLLRGQSKRKSWTKHFVKYGDSPESAWNHWKGLYHLSMFMAQGSFLAAGYKLYTLPKVWSSGAVLFKHTLGIMLIALHAWTSTSIFESLGEFGWFYGDFFFDNAAKLTYSGIYRYLNNPERLIGCAGIWGVVLITSSPPMLFLALVSHISLLLFLQLVEKPHMEKLYGSQLRKEAGIAKNLKRVVPSQLINLQGSMDRVVAEAQDFVGDFVKRALPKVQVDNFVQDTRVLLANVPTRLTISRLEEDLPATDLSDYSLSIPDAEVSPSGALTIPYGKPIRVRWTAPKTHSKKDWIALYRVADNSSRSHTRTVSAGRWNALVPGVYDGPADSGILVHEAPLKNKPDVVTGEVIFSGDKLFWRAGVYEFRYHHDGRHGVTAITPAFEITLTKYMDPTPRHDFDESISHPTQPDAAQELHMQTLLLQLVRDCLDSSEDLAPENVDEEFGGRGERKYAERIVYAVREVFGVDFAPEVVCADGNVRRLAWRIWNAKKVLAPFSLGTGSGGESGEEEGDSEGGKF